MNAQAHVQSPSPHAARRRPGVKASKVVMNVAAVLIAALMLFPILWIVLNSFKPEAEIFAQPITLLPKTFTLESYTKHLGANDVFGCFKNTLIVSLGALALGLVLGVPSAYGLARYRMRTAKLVMLLFLISQMMPASLTLTPLYLIYVKLNLLNNYLGPMLAIATISIPFIVVTTRPFFLSLPKELDNAARIDGCNAFTAFWRIMLPIAKPGLVTAGVLAFIFGWNDLIYSITFNTKAAFKPLLGIVFNLMRHEGVKWSGVMALATVAILPIVALFLAMQDQIVGGLAAGAVKE
ncbi:MAG TPA: carbohydrate ABC transporter permease [Candidatus Excrementavichristensenella intestinipullorum]|nr:carbohydrate ABC transporter permease [Candidatus Excrementavichristensenella intestinipullorum]